MRMNRTRAGIALLLMLTAVGFARPMQKPAEATASVPELTAFHEVIYKIWHEAWPNKNAVLLRQLLPDVENGIAKVAAAQLPGILREKKAAWDQGVQNLQSAGNEYKTAASEKEDARLFAAAEALHARFEALMRAIRPPLKELDEFHAVLYMLYHHYMPGNQMVQIKSSVADLKKKMDVLEEVKLPERLRDKDNDFRAARGLLSGSVAALENKVQSKDAGAIKEAIEAVHSNYQKLEKVLE